MFSSIAIKIVKMISTLICVVIWEIILQIYSSKTYTENAIPEQGQLFLYSYENEFLDNMIRSGQVV